MKTTPGFNPRSFLLIAAFLAGLGGATHASANAKSYLIDLNSRTATELGMGWGWDDTRAHGINDKGQVTGDFSTYYPGEGFDGGGFITGSHGVGVERLAPGGHSYATAINDTGQVVGSAYMGGGSHAFITGPDAKGMRDLGTLGGSYSVAYGINNAGQVAGWSYTPGGSIHAFITCPDGTGMRDLGTLGGYSSYAYAINEAGQVVGHSFTSGDGIHAFITGPDGTGMRDLGTLGGDYSEAHGINDAGQVVGESGGRAFITGPDGTGMRDLGTLNGNISEAYGINEAGQVVGESGGRAFITGPDGIGMTYLNSLVDLPHGYAVSYATGINNAGEVIATLSAIPEPATYALLLAGLGLIRAIVWRKKGTGPFQPEAAGLPI